jgi:predicted DCC family thiol-disulfide oxidoreductase YuxK
MTRWLANPGETALVLALALAGAAWPPLLGAAALLFAVLEIRAGRRGSPEPRWWPDLWPARTEPMAVLYDDACGLCVRSKERLERWPTAAAFRFVPVRSPEAAALAPGLPPERLAASMHVVAGDGLWSAERAWGKLMQAGPWPLALAVRLLPPFASGPLYRWIARRRFAWFGRVPAAADPCGGHDACPLR